METHGPVRVKLLRMKWVFSLERGENLVRAGDLELFVVRCLQRLWRGPELDAVVHTC